MIANYEYCDRKYIEWWLEWQNSRLPTSQPEYKATVSRAIFFYFQWEEQEEEENQKNTAGSQDFHYKCRLII